VAEAYGLEVTGCVLLRSLVNDVYRIDTPAGPYVLKLYGPRHRGDVAWEVRLAAHVAAGGVAIACGVPLSDGRLAGKVTMPEGPRPYTLWEWAPGDRAPRPFDDDLYRRFGMAIARFHAAAAGIDSAPRVTRMESLLDDVLARVDAADRLLISSLAAATSRHLAEVGPQLDRGVCHGDVTLDNAHIDGDRIVLYDLDRACENWRAWDLVGVAATPHWPAFLAGYRVVRPLADLDVAALPWLDVLLRIDYLHFHLFGKPAFRGTDSLREGWVDQNLKALRAAAPTLLA
jgi:Ser/Thr protein kinase RdoA (MazF antagonist)